MDTNLLTYSQVVETSMRMHDSLLRWVRERLRLAGLEEVEVYGRFLAEGTTTPHVVLFPYQVAPDPKLLDHAPGASLIRLARARGATPPSLSPFIPSGWRDLSDALSDAMVLIFRELGGSGSQGRQEHRAPGQPVALDMLPAPLRRWFEQVVADTSVPWHNELLSGNAAQALFPSLWWHPGYVLSAYYLLLAHDSGRGVQSATSRQASLSLPVLSLLATAIQRERVLRLEQPARVLQPELSSWIGAILEALPPISAAREALDIAWSKVQLDEAVQLAIEPVLDLNDQAFAMIMQALQRPLQPALNLRLRMRLGDGPELSSALYGELGLSQAKPGPVSSREGSAASEGGRASGESYAGYQRRVQDELRARIQALRESPYYSDAPFETDSGLAGPGEAG